MTLKCPDCERKTALHATEYVEDSNNPFFAKRLKKINNCPFCGAEISDA